MQLELNLEDQAVRSRVVQAHQRLCELYGCPIRYSRNQNPLSELVSALLSHRTKNVDSRQAFQQLQARFKSWEAVRDAPVGAVEAAIAPCTWPEQKAPRLQQVLHTLTERCGGALTLDFLQTMSVPEARAWLEAIPGIGPKTSAAVLSFSSLRRRALAVDSHHHRVAVRLGLISEAIAVGPAHRVLEAQLPDDWDSQQVYDNHEVLMLHGQQVCHFHRPCCDRCCLLDMCPFGQQQMSSLQKRGSA